MKGINLSLSMISGGGGIFLKGKPQYIHPNAYFDIDQGLLTLGEGIVISANTIILTHDYSPLVGLKAAGLDSQYKYNHSDFTAPVTLDDYSFIGAGAVLLPGTSIGKYSIVGANSLVKGSFPDYAIIAGNPAKIIGDARVQGQKFLQKNSVI